MLFRSDLRDRDRNDVIDGDLLIDAAGGTVVVKVRKGGAWVDLPFAGSQAHRLDVIATCATAVRGRNVSAWNAMSLQQKADAVQAELDAWAAIRGFVASRSWT